jgi:hypothetical protein
MFDARRGSAGRLAVCQVRNTLPRMRINAKKVREMAEGSEIVVAEFAVAASHRSKVLSAFRSQGTGLLSEAIRANRQAVLSVSYDIEKCVFVVAESTWPVW